jgi:PAS domain S-box-containing protein
MKILLISARPGNRERLRHTIQQAYPEAQLLEVADAEGLDEALAHDDLTLAVAEPGPGGLAWPTLSGRIRARRPALPLVLAGEVQAAVGRAALGDGAADVVLMEQLYRLPGAIGASLKRLPAAATPRPEQPADRIRAALEEAGYLGPLFAEAPIGIALARAGHMLAANPAYLKLFGYRVADQVIGRPLLHDIAPQERAQIAALVRQRDQGGNAPAAYETVGQRVDGSQFPFYVEVARITVAGEPLSLAFFTDITARKQAEGQLSFLAQASKLLATSLDYEVTLTRVAQLCVSRLADWCSVDMLGEDGVVRRVALAHADPVKMTLAHEAQLRYAIELARAHPILEVIRSGRPELVPEIPDSMLQAMAQDAEDLASMRALGFKSALSVPLPVRGRVLGALSFVTAESGRRYSPADVAFAQEIASRAAVAIDNARLYRLAQEQREQLSVTLASIGDGVIATDTLGRVTLLNPIAEALVGWSQAEALGRPLDEVFVIVNEASRAAVESPVSKVLREGAIVGLANHTVLLSRDGREIPIDDSGAPIRDADGKLLGVVLVFHDVTEARRAEAALREQEALFRTMADSSPVLIWMTDTARACTFTNQSWLTFTGRSLEQELGFGWLDSVHPDDYERCVQVFGSAFDARQPFSMDYRLRRADGEYRWLLDIGVPRWTEEGAFVGYIGSCVDITGRKESEDRDRFLFELLDATRSLSDSPAITATSAAYLGRHLGVDRCAYAEVAADENHFTITGDYNTPGTASIVGYFAMSDFGDEVLWLMRAGQPYVVHDTTADPRVDASMSAYLATQIAAVICVPLQKDGRFVACMAVHQRAPRLWTSAEVELVQLVANLCWESIERARVMRALQESEERLQALYVQEQAARAEAEQASRLKDEFLATVSHELRTPLTPILGYGELLQARRRDEEYVARAADKIVRSARSQAQLIDDLLDVSRIVTGKLRLEPRPMDLVAVIHTAIESVRPAIDAKALSFSTSLPPTFRPFVGDPDRLQQVIWNLLSNAVKFTPAGGSVTIELARTSEGAQIAVRDSGRGINPAFLPFVFERFRQADSASNRRFGGLGLGLSIVRHLAELHGGTVQAESAGEGQGATFIVRLPFGLRAAAEEPPQQSQGAGLVPHAQLAGLRILVVDDQPMILDLLQDTLTMGGAEVRTSDTAREGLEIVREWRPDILISDIAMPGEDGFWLIQAVRALGPAEGGLTPALALTAYVRVEDRLRVLAAGFQQYIPKPVVPAELLSAVIDLAEER